MADDNQRNQDEDANWLLNVKEKLGETPLLTSKWSICKVPRKLRDVNRDAYSPQILSIGPIHHGKNDLPSMKTEKEQYAKALFRRTQNDIEACDACGKAMLGLAKNVRTYYKEPLTESMEDQKLAELLLFDGCFILELFLRYSSNLNYNEDPIFTTSWMIPSLRCDLALLENQIPYMVLDVLYLNLTMRCGPATQLRKPLIELSLCFFKSVVGLDNETIVMASSQSTEHLLHLLHNCYIPTSNTYFRSTKIELDPIYCATALREHGIKFIRKDEAKNILNLSFDKGLFSVPKLVIDDLTDSLFRNLIAFEQCCHGDTPYVSSYVWLMDRLVDTAADVELLERERIIENNLGGGNDVSEFLNNICKQVTVKRFYFAGLSKEVNDYCKKDIHRYGAALKRDYFKNPWTIISFVGGIFLLVLTSLQTVYSIMSYY